MVLMQGSISSIRGIVVDIKFEGDVPNIYDALKVQTKNADGQEVVVEVLQQLEDGYVRGIAMTSTDGLKRGDMVTATGAPIKVPVGPQVLGHIFNVLGETIDGTPQIKGEEQWPIHREAPKFTELSTSSETLVTGIKVIDLLAPVLK